MSYYNRRDEGVWNIAWVCTIVVFLLFYAACGATKEEKQKRIKEMHEHRYRSK